MGLKDEGPMEANHGNLCGKCNIMLPFTTRVMMRECLLPAQQDSGFSAGSSEKSFYTLSSFPVGCTLLLVAPIPVC
jgi:hypothetical protein